MQLTRNLSVWMELNVSVPETVIEDWSLEIEARAAHVYPALEI